jgi:anti-sigma factor RsiW
MAVRIEAELQTHLAGCPACATYAADLESLHALVATAPPAEPSANFDWRLRLRLAKAEAGELPLLFDAKPGRDLGWLHFAVSAAAAAVLVVVVGTHLQPSKPAAVADAGPIHAIGATPSGAGRVYPVSDGTPIGPQPAPSYSYFMQEPAPASPIDSAQAAPTMSGGEPPR